MNESDELGPQPEPTIEEPQRAPGGADAVELPEEVLGRDLPTGSNPAVKGDAPEAVSEPEDKQQEGEGEDKESGSAPV